MQSRSLAKVFAVLALGLGALGATTAARAGGGHVNLSIGVGIPLGAPVYVQPVPQPVYVQPAPVVVPQTIYSQPQVVYTQPPVVYAPAPVVYPRAAFVVGGPVYRSGWYGHGHHGHGHGRHWR